MSKTTPRPKPNSAETKPDTSTSNMAEQVDPARSDPEAAGVVLDSDDAVIYRATIAYWIVAAVGLIATVMLVFDMTGGLRWDTVFFAVIGLIGGLWSLWMASTRIVALPDGLLVQRATAQYLVDYRQLLRAEASGRMLGVVALIYHPRRDDGIIDTNAVGSLLVPGVRNQSALLETITQRLAE